MTLMAYFVALLTYSLDISALHRQLFNHGKVKTLWPFATFADLFQHKRTHGVVAMVQKIRKGHASAWVFTVKAKPGVLITPCR